MKDKLARDEIEKLQKEVKRLGELNAFMSVPFQYNYLQSYPLTVGVVLSKLMEFLNLDVTYTQPDKVGKIEIKYSGKIQ